MMDVACHPLTFPLQTDGLASIQVSQPTPFFSVFFILASHFSISFESISQQIKLSHEWIVQEFPSTFSKHWAPRLIGVRARSPRGYLLWFRTFAAKDANSYVFLRKPASLSLIVQYKCQPRKCCRSDNSCPSEPKVLHLLAFPLFPPHSTLCASPASSTESVPPRCPADIFRASEFRLAGPEARLSLQVLHLLQQRWNKQPANPVSFSISAIIPGLAISKSVLTGHIHRVVPVGTMNHRLLPVLLPLPMFLQQVRHQHLDVFTINSFGSHV